MRVTVESHVGGQGKDRIPVESLHLLVFKENQIMVYVETINNDFA